RAILGPIPLAGGLLFPVVEVFYEKPLSRLARADSGPCCAGLAAWEPVDGLRDGWTAWRRPLVWRRPCLVRRRRRPCLVRRRRRPCLVRRRRPLFGGWRSRLQRRRLLVRRRRRHGRSGRTGRERPHGVG